MMIDWAKQRVCILAPNVELSHQREHSVFFLISFEINKLAGVVGPDFLGLEDDLLSSRIHSIAMLSQ
jgi:hypothetical protein